MDYQGHEIATEPFDTDKTPVSVGRYLMQTLIDSVPNERSGKIYGRVAKDNLRSVRLCTRTGLTVEKDDEDPTYTQRWEP